MINLIKHLFSLLTSRQRRQFFALQILVVFMAVAETAGVASIIPFMALVGNMSQLQQDTFIAQIYQASGVNSETQFLFLLGFGVLGMLFIATLISSYTIWTLSMFSNKIGAEIADRLYTHYLKQGWLFHASGSSALLTKKIAIESMRVTTGILLPLMHVNAKTILALLMISSIFIYDPMVAIIIFSIFALAYSVLFTVVRMRLQKNGRIISTVNEQRFRLMNEGFGGIKDVLLLGRDSDFIERFNKTGISLAKSLGTNDALGTVPRYIMELVAFGSMIAVVLYLIANYEGNLGVILPILSVYALAGVKLLPAFQSVYTSIAKIRAHSPAFESIQDDLTHSKSTKLSTSNSEDAFLVPQKKSHLKM